MLNFFKTIRDSIYSPGFYSKIPASSLGSALKYFFLFILFVQLIGVLKLAPEIVVSLPEQARKFSATASDFFPSELVLTIKSGEVSTNVEEPYYIWDKNGNKIVVIDTKTPYSAAQFNDYGAAAWLTKDTIFYMGDSQGKIESININGVSDMTVDRNFVASILNKLTPLIPFIGPAILLFLFVMMYLGLTFRLVYLFFLALLIWLVSKIMKKGLSYGQSYKVGVYAMTLGIIVDAIKMFAGWGGFPFMFTFISLGVFIVNTKSKLPVDTPK